MSGFARYAQTFQSGVANVRIDVKIKRQDVLFGLWLRFIPFGDQRGMPDQFPVVVGGDQDEAGKERVERVVFATTQFNEIHDDLMLGRGVWYSLRAERHSNCVVPLLGWRTGHPRVDQMLEMREHFPEFLDYHADLGRDLGWDAVEALREKLVTHMRVRVSPSRINVGFDAIGDQVFEHTETFVGPLNPFF